MPMVHDSADWTSPAVWPALTWVNHTFGSTQVVPGGVYTGWLSEAVSKTQYGFRSHGRESRDPDAALAALSRTSRRIDQPRLIELMDIVASMTTQAPRGHSSHKVTNERDYMSSSLVSPTGILSVSFRPNSPTLARPDLDGEIALVVRPSATFTDMAASAQDAGIASRDPAKAASLLRSARPDKPHAGLAQFVGELRDLPRTLSAWADGLRAVASGSVAGINPGVHKTGERYLEVQFGTLPLISDIQRMADAVIHSEKYLRGFVSHAGQEIHRSRVWSDSETTFSNSSIGLTGAKSSVGTLISPYLLGGVMNRYAVTGLPPAGGGHAVAEVSTTVRHKAYADFEYFIADPDGFLGRTRDYQAKARYLLGASLGPDTVYELVPWSWLLDWWSDIGGLLAYQESVATDSLVMRNSGYVTDVTTVARGFATYSSLTTNSYGSTRTTGSAESWSEARWQQRSAGSPYDLGGSLAFTGKQWSILGALGATRAPGRL